MGPPLFACGQPIDPRLPAMIAAGNPSGDGRLDGHFGVHTSIYVGNGGIVHASDYYE